MAQEFSIARGGSRPKSPIELTTLIERKNFDATTFLSVILLTAAGFVAIYSATYAAQMKDRFSLQLMFAAGGLAIMLITSMLPAKWLSVAAYPFYMLCLGLLVYVLIAGKQVYGQRNWIVIGSVQFQPSELAKLGVIMAVAKYHMAERDMTRFIDVVITSLFVIVPIGLILLEPDPGTAMLFAGLLVILLLWTGVDLFVLFAGIGPAIVAVFSLFGRTPMLISVVVVGLMLFFVFRKSLLMTVLAFALVLGAALSTDIIYQQLPPYQQKRVLVMLEPELDPLGAGYNVIQTRMAIGSGGIIGKGYLKGTQTQLRYVPKQWTDFIISVPAEEFGFIGVFVLLILYAFVIFRGVAIASSVRSKFSSVMAIGIAGIWFLHVTVNIGMSIGLFPIVGIPLPFMSYGGSALVTNLLMAGVLMNLYRNRRVMF
jgi:rod shape determining protein RodA